MSTDITIEQAPERVAIDFETYARTRLPLIGRALSVAIDDVELATTALDEAIRTVRGEWSTIDGFDEASHRLVAVVVGRVADEPPSRLKPEQLERTITRTSAVTHLGLDWPLDVVANLLSLPLENLDTALSLATEAFDSTDGELQDHVRTLIANAAPTLPDLGQITNEQQRLVRRKRHTISAIGVALVVLVIVLLAQLVSRAERPAVADQPAAPAPLTEQNPSDDQTGDEQPAPSSARDTTGQPSPDHIAADGQGGFVGVQSPSRAQGPVVFSRSPDGETWSFVGESYFGEAPSVTRFERSADHFVAWFDGVPLLADPAVQTVAVSPDLTSWTLLELELRDEAPSGLLYESAIADVSVSADNVLALVRTTVEIDFGALSLSEGYTCGHTITGDEVTVNLCNESELDVLSLSDIAQLPARTRLFVSRAGGSFEETTTPFGEDTAARLTNADGEFAITTSTGVRFATSKDAQTWQTAAAARPWFPIRAATTNAADEVVGVGDRGISNDRSRGPRDPVIVLFYSNADGSITQTTLLSELLGPIDEDVRAVVASGPTRWVVYVFEPLTRAWLLSSADGLTWDVLPTSPPIGDSPRLLVGDDEALVQWIDNDGEAITLAVPLP